MIVEMVKNNVKPTDVSVLRLEKCVIADATTVSRVRISRQCICELNINIMYSIENVHL